MDWLSSLYPEVQDVLLKAVPAYWPGLGVVLEEFLEGALPTEAALPLAACRAVGGNPKQATHVAAGVIAAVAALRILDDLLDLDRPGALWEQVGPVQSWNYAAAAQMLALDIVAGAPLRPEVTARVCRAFTHAFLRVSAGQDRDLAGLSRTLEEYWLTTAMKSGFAYGTACAAGAMVGSESSELVSACRQFGLHLGYVIQLFNDLESIWQPDGASDLEQGKVSLPLLYALQVEHPQQEELRNLVEAGDIGVQSERVVEILEAAGAREYVVWAALEEREKGLNALRVCPEPAGGEALAAYMSGIFGDIELFVPGAGL